MRKVFYGFRYISGRHTIYLGDGRIAGCLYGFKTKEELDDWIYDEIFRETSPERGERVSVTRKEALRLVGKDNLEECRKGVLGYCDICKNFLENCECCKKCRLSPWSCNHHGCPARDFGLSFKEIIEILERDDWIRSQHHREYEEMYGNPGYLNKYIHADITVTHTLYHEKHGKLEIEFKNHCTWYEYKITPPPIYLSIKGKFTTTGIKLDEDSKGAEGLTYIEFVNDFGKNPKYEKYHYLFEKFSEVDWDKISEDE